MRITRIRMLTPSAVLAVVVCTAFTLGVRTSTAQSKDKKMTVDQMIARHLDSIGTEEARKGISSITGVGSVQASFKGRGEGRAEGIVVFGSQAEKNMIGMKFNNPDYPYEKMGYDGSNFSVGFVRPGEYTILGQFLRINERTFKTGLLGGTLSTSWDLLNFSSDVGKLRAKGKSKIEGKEYLKYSYDPKKGSDLDITLFFDPETFQHVRTEYRRIISGGQGLSVDNSARQNETRYRMIEDFGGFREVEGLTLPHTYKLYLELLTGNGTTSYTWDVELQQFSFNQELSEAEFKMGGL